MLCVFFGPLQIQKMVISGGDFKPDALKTKEMVSLLLDDDEMKSRCKYIVLDVTTKTLCTVLHMYVCMYVRIMYKRESSSQPGFYSLISLQFWQSKQRRSRNRERGGEARREKASQTAQESHSQRN